MRFVGKTERISLRRVFAIFMSGYVRELGTGKVGNEALMAHLFQLVKIKIPNLASKDGVAADKSEIKVETPPSPEIMVDKLEEGDNW